MFFIMSTHIFIIFIIMWVVSYSPISGLGPVQSQYLYVCVLPTLPIPPICKLLIDQWSCTIPVHTLKYVQHSYPSKTITLHNQLNTNRRYWQMRRTIQNKYKRPTGPQSRDTLVLPLQACTPVVSVVLYSQRGTDTTLLHVTIPISTHQRDATQPGE